MVEEKEVESWLRGKRGKKKAGNESPWTSSVEEEKWAESVSLTNLSCEEIFLVPVRICLGLLEKIC